MNKTIGQGKEEVAALCQYFATNREAFLAPGVKEAHVRQSLIDPLFEALGWDVRNKAMIAPQYREIVPEDSLDVEGQQKSPDYTFRVGTLPKFYAEAKKCGVNIGADPACAFQLRRYGWSAKMALSILTDFEELAVYDCTARPRPSDKASNARIQYFRYDEYPDRWRELWDVFSREAVWSGAFDQFAASKRKRGTSEVDAEFLKEMEGWRLVLAGNIALRNKTLSLDDLNSAVQLTIDRVVFLRMAEDRGLEPYEQLLKLCERPEIYSRFMRDLCRRADQKYNSGLFHFQKESGVSEDPDRITPKLSIDDKVFIHILQSLYFAYGSPYHFGVLPVELLGTVYERFLGKVIRLTAGHQARIEDKPEVRKAGGVYYTPAYIVDYIVRHTVAAQIEGRSPAQLAGGKDRAPFRVLDMACGSGSFLLGAYQCLLDFCLNWYIEHKPESFKKAVYKDPRNGQWRLRIEEKKRILTTHIFGVDIDLQAVEVSKLSLLLKVLEGETDQSISLSQLPFGDRALPNLANNIKRGNSLIASDFSMIPDDLVNVRAFDWNVAFEDAMKAGGFDVIIGNPPYVRIQGFPHSQLEYLTTHYQAVTGNCDLYVSFIERGYFLLKPGARLGQIVPNKFMKTDYGRGLRKLISAKRALAELVDFGANQVFESTTYACLLFLTKEANDSFQYAQTEAKREALVAAGLSVRSSSHLSEEAWSMSDVETAGLLEKLSRGTIRLLDLPAEMSRGSSTGNDEVFVLEANQTVIEDGPLRVPIFAADFGRYSFSPSGKWQILFPYRVDGLSARLYTEQEMKVFPKAFSYLNGHRRILKKRKQNGAWYGFSAPRNLPVHDHAQIMVPLLADHGLCALIPPNTNGSLCPMAGAGFTVTLGATCLLRPEYVLGLLNSKLLFWWLQQKSNVFRGGWITCTKQYFGEVPLRRLDLSTPKQKDQHDALVDLVNMMLGLTAKLARVRVESERQTLQNAVTATDKEIDRLVYDLYGLTDEEIAIVEKEETTS